MGRRIRVLLVIAVLGALLLPLASCGGGGGNGGGTPANNWDEMNWDQGVWQ